jgi:uncharacterized membrane protein
MTFDHLTTLRKSILDLREQVQNHRQELTRLCLLTVVFLGFMLIFSLHRYYTFYASYDHGLFNQLFWNSLHGRFFQSSLTSGNSVAVLEDGKIPVVNFLHLAHHFVPDFMLWLPFYALHPAPETLVVLQVCLMTAGGLVLYALSRHYHPPTLSLLITAGYFGANAVIGPTFANFYEQCQIPLFAFGLLLALEKQRWGIFWLMATLVLGIREDAGMILFGVGLYMLFSQRFPRSGMALCLVSFAYVVIVTNFITPQFSDDASRLYFAVKFKQFVKGNESPSTLQVLWGMVTHPVELLQSLLTPFDRRFFYMVGQWLPLAFVPAISPASWTIAGIPLIALLAQSTKLALVITVRYAIALVPGIFYGTVLWWAHHSQRPIPPKPTGKSLWQIFDWTYRTRILTPVFRRFWIACMVVSILSVIAANPNQAFYFLVPDSFHPWVLVPLTRQWEHTSILNRMVAAVPADASVSATTHVIPQLSTRQKILRLPALQLKNDEGQIEDMEYLIADLWRHQQYQAIFKNERKRLENLIPFIDQIIVQSRYGVLQVEDGVVFMQKGVASKPAAIATWNLLKHEILSSLANLKFKRN